MQQHHQIAVLHSVMVIGISEHHIVDIPVAVSVTNVPENATPDIV